MTRAYRVDLVAVDDVVARLTGFENYLSDRLDELEARVERMRGRWSGTGYDGYTDAQREWDSGAEEMKRGITQMREAARTAHTSYSNVIATNAKMFGRG